LTKKLHPAHDIVRSHGSGLARNLYAIAKQDQRRNATDTIFTCNGLCLLGIKLGQAQPRFQPGCSLFKCGRHHLARPAPRRPEVDHHGDVTAFDVLPEAAGTQRHRMSCEQALFALAAARRIGQACSGNPVDCRAAGTDDMF
jgi:hypothetical protein